MKNLFLYFACALLLIGSNSCKKDNAKQNGTSKVAIHLTDAPGNYEAVYIDVQSVEIGTAADTWIELPLYRRGVYNLLDFRNGLDTLICQVDIPSGAVSQMRLKLGTNNAVKVDGVVYPLATPSAQQSGLKFNIKADLLPNTSYNFWIDFDAGRSIVEKGNGDYSLKPVIRTYTELTDGRIKGYILPLSAISVVYAVNGSDTFSVIPEADGRFVFCGLPEGNYKVVFDSRDGSGFTDLEVNNVQVKFGVVTDLGNLVLLP